jgi:anti-sigma factor RsiW
VKESDRMVISAYLDGEVEAPWKSQVERRITDDPEWAAEASAQTRLRVVLSASPEPDFTEALGRVRQRVSAPLVIRSLPLGWLSVAAAALLVVAAGGGFLWGRSTGTAPADIAEIQVQVPSQIELKLSGEGQLLMASTLKGKRP